MEVSGDPKTFAATIRNELAAGDHVTLVIKTPGQHHDDSLFLLRASTKSLYGLGLLALLLTASGLHGVASAIVVITGITAALQPAARILKLQPGDIVRTE